MKYQVNEDNVITGIFYNEDVNAEINMDINFGMDKYIDGQVVKANHSEVATQKIVFENVQNEFNSKAHRTIYMDAYRKYQTAVLFGEFQRVPAVESFIAALKNKDWSVLNNVPNGIKYFTGEVGLAESGLIKGGN